MRGRNRKILLLKLQLQIFSIKSKKTGILKSHSPNPLLSMSLIHLEKSVLTFHLKEILEDGHGNHPLTWLSLGILIFGPKVLPSAVKSQPATKMLKAKRSEEHTQISLSQWIAEAKHRELAAQGYTVIENQAALSSEKGKLKPDTALIN